MVICIEVTDDNHAPSKRMQPHFVNLAREVPNIPFFRARIGLGRTFDEVRERKNKEGIEGRERVHVASVSIMVCVPFVMSLIVIVICRKLMNYS